MSCSATRGVVLLRLARNDEYIRLMLAHAAVTAQHRPFVLTTVRSRFCSLHLDLELPADL